MTRVARCKWTIRRFKNKEATQVTLCGLIYKVAVVNNKYRVLLWFFFFFFFSCLLLLPWLLCWCRVLDLLWVMLLSVLWTAGQHITSLISLSPITHTPRNRTTHTLPCLCLSPLPVISLSVLTQLPLRQHFGFLFLFSSLASGSLLCQSFCQLSHLFSRSWLFIPNSYTWRPFCYALHVFL